jgi:hypothetical protein
MTPLVDAEEQARLDALAIRIAQRGQISVESVWRLFNDIFRNRDGKRRYVLTEAGHIELVVTSKRPQTKPEAPKRKWEELVASMRASNASYRDDQPKPHIPTWEEYWATLQEGERRYREMDFIDYPVSRSYHFWSVSVLPEEMPGILTVWDAYYSAVRELESHESLMRESEEAERSVVDEEEVDEEETRPRYKPFPSEFWRECMVKDRVLVMETRRVWHRERQRVLPCRVVVNNDREG